MKLFRWLFLFAILSTSCTTPDHQKNEITKVELAKIIAISNYGTALDIDDSLNYTYYGKANDVKPAYYKGRISSAFWDTLNRKLERIKYKAIDTSDKSGAIDGEYYELIVHWKNGKRRITRLIAFEPDSLSRVLNWLDSSYKCVKLHRAKETFKFETTFQNPPPPPKPKIDQVKFPPPAKQ